MICGTRRGFYPLLPPCHRVAQYSRIRAHIGAIGDPPLERPPRSRLNRIQRLKGSSLTSEIRMRTVRFAYAVLPLLAGLFLLAPVRAGETKPNFVVIFIDDLGYADIGPFGATKQKTPNL